MKKFLTIKNNDEYYRIIKFEESVTDRSIFVCHLWHLNLKNSYHTNHGKMKPPFRSHIRGCAGNMISGSIDKRQKFITDYVNEFQTVNFRELPKGSLIEKPYSHDVVLDITNKGFSKYKIVLFSYNRKDLLDGNFNNATIGLIELNTHKIIVGCFNN